MKSIVINVLTSFLTKFSAGSKGIQEEIVESKRVRFHWNRRIWQLKLNYSFSRRKRFSLFFTWSWVIVLRVLDLDLLNSRNIYWLHSPVGNISAITILETNFQLTTLIEITVINCNSTEVARISAQWESLSLKQRFNIFCKNNFSHLQMGCPDSWISKWNCKTRGSPLNYANTS